MDIFVGGTRKCENCKYNRKNTDTDCFDRWYKMNGVTMDKDAPEDKINCWEQE